jgi:hypothetical protein
MNRGCFLCSGVQLARRAGGGSHQWTRGAHLRNGRADGGPRLQCGGQFPAVPGASVDAHGMGGKRGPRSVKRGNPKVQAMCLELYIGAQ